MGPKYGAGAEGVIDTEPRCWRCERKLAESVGRPWKIKCKRCNAMNASEPVDKVVEMK
jgi:phage FluMu protein Com